MSTEPNERKPSKAEAIKEQSQGLAGSIAETMADPAATHLSDDDNMLLKFHGSYQQDDRDRRTELKKQGLDKAWMFMARAKIPGGRVTAEQYLALDELADGTNGTLRVTSRQGIQFHGVGKERLKEVIARINEVRLTTLGACGDVNRNVMACPVCDLDGRAGLGLERLAAELAERFAPRSTAYWEVWCDGEKWGEPVVTSREEPFYGKSYLPRKFKIGLIDPADNCIDGYTHDLCFEAVRDAAGRLAAFDLLVGGGMGFTHGNKETFSRLGTRLARIAPEHAVETAEAIIAIQRDTGDRSERKHARLKYTLEDHGAAWLRAELERRLGRELAEAGPAPAYAVLDHLGWHEAADGTLYVGLHLPSGRIADTADGRRRTGLRELVRRFRPQVRLTPHSNVVLAGLRPADRAEAERIIAGHGLATDRELGALRRRAHACVALPTCGLALAEAERELPGLLAELERLGVGAAPVELRLSGCPNSCVRTTMGEIGLVGRGPGKYALYVGGSQLGTRLAYLLKEMVEVAAVPYIISSLIGAWQQQTGGSLAFGDWAAAQGAAALTGLCAQDERDNDTISGARGPLHS